MSLLTVMWDDINVSLLPAGYDAYAGYVDGGYENYSAVKKKFPKARVLSIDVNATNTLAECLDVEPGDATNAKAVQWVKAKIAAKASLIVLYTSVSNIDVLALTLIQAGIAPGAVKFWSAHYKYGTHICGPTTCGLCALPCDGTQFTNSALGDSLDESVLLDGFFGPPGPATPYPTLTPGDTGIPVRALQALLNVWGYRITVDGSFGPSTETAVRDFQARVKLVTDGVAGPLTWGKLLTTPPPPPAPGPKPYPAPGHIGEDFSRYPLHWDAVTVGGKVIGHYNVHVVQLDGKTVLNATVTGTSLVLAKLVPAWHYKVYVGALGGPGTPQYAGMEIIA